jgi:hypothetical protein
MGHFPWDDPVLFRGEFIQATTLPWHYIPFWILITTPVLYTVFFLAGSGFLVFRKWKRILDDDILIDLLQLALFTLPLLAVIILRSTLYDGWRQMFFLYGPFMMLVMKGFYDLLQRCKGLNPRSLSRITRLFIFIFVIWSTTSTLHFMIKYHPHQNVYFNFLAGKETTKNFEADYWGLSYRQALEYLLEYDKRDSIPLYAINFPGMFNAQILPVEQRKRLNFVEQDEADYWLSNYRFPGEHDRYFRKDPPYDKVLWEKKVKGNPIVGIYLLE